ncbi:hypothetical protein [Citricoccus alkalitolerans]|uniref:Lipoprotein n=1 Tax=Citricoccus alkalitolerans TaxID=246603 RepID=A0ABV8XZD0_9MICC
MQRKGLVLAGAFSLLLFSGCSQGSGGVGLLDEPATADQTLPADLYGGDVEPDSARWVAKHEGISYFLAKPAEPGLAHGVCLVAMEAESIACGGPSSNATQLVSLDTAGTEARVVRDGTDTTELTDEGWTQIHENLLVR